MEIVTEYYSFIHIYKKHLTLIEKNNNNKLRSLLSFLQIYLSCYLNYKSILFNIHKRKQMVNYSKKY